MNDLGFGDLGFYNLSVLYLFLIFGTLFSTSVITRVGYRISFAIGSLGIALWIVTSVFPALKNYETDPYKRDNTLIYKDAFIYPVMIIASAACGLSSGVLWTVQGIYTAECATESTKGFYFSYFWFTYMLS
jgi:MFS family permease